MKTKLEALTRNLSRDQIDLATDSAKKIILDSFKLNGESTIKVLTNPDFSELGYSPLALILSQGYMNAANELGMNSEVLLTTSKKVTDKVSQEEIQFMRDTKEKDLMLFVLNNKQGSYSKTIGRNILATTILKENKARYGQHFRLGEIGLEDKTDMTTYLRALSMDYTKTQELGMKIKELLEKTSTVTIISQDGSRLTYEGGFKEPRVYCGNFDGANNNFGGNLPSGETFTELKDLEGVNGRAQITAYGALEQVTLLKKPELIEIKNGHLTNTTDTALLDLLNVYKAENDEEFQRLFEQGHLIRELGFGVNYEIGKQKALPNVIWVEKTPGFHTSIGLSHTFYNDEKINEIAQRIDKKPKGHTDILIATKQILLDNKIIFQNGEYLI